ncbi:MAG TPA: hypothetical protein VFV38_22135 [Ktedonobacteraceae bacterium]|nr:hypothetical protein [Ktedonobacteraceae bacterium]
MATSSGGGSAQDQTIRKLVNSYQAQIRSLKLQLGETKTGLTLAERNLAEKDALLRLANQELKYLKRVSFAQFLFGLLGTFLAGFGTAYLTATPPNQVGWLMIVSAIAVETLSFFFGR